MLVTTNDDGDSCNGGGGWCCSDYHENDVDSDSGEVGWY